jgi:hypothetical protein
VTILQQQKTLAFVSLLVQLNNNQSILSPACWSYLKTKLLPGYTYYTLSPKSKLFLAALQVTEQQSLTAQMTERTTTATTTGEEHRQQHSSSNRATTPVVVRTRMCRAYSTSPNLPRSGTLPNPDQSAARYGMYDELVWTDHSIDQQVVPRLVTHSNPYPYIRVL